MAKSDAQKQVAVFKVSINAIPEGEKRRPHRTIAVAADADLYGLAEAINDAFDFDFDHAFGFYDNLKDPYRAKTKYELFADGGASPFEGLSTEGLLESLDESAMLQLTGMNPAAAAVMRAMKRVDFQALQLEIESELEEIVFRHASGRFQAAFLPHIPSEHQEAAKAMLEAMARDAYRTPSEDELDDLGLIPGDLDVDEGTFGVKETPILSVFSAARPKWCYLFDYGDDWTFEVAFLRLEPREPKARYPKVLESKGTPPEQYPDTDE